MEIVTQKSRIDLVDALLGFALVSIMLLHNIEHFDFYFTPEGLPGWMQKWDKHVWDAMFLLFGGKSYGIFAMLFGFTFHLQIKSASKRGIDFSRRFAWRLVLLFCFGLVNSIFYQGDILALYAVVGFLLIPVAHWSNKSLLILATILLLQPLQWISLFLGIGHSDTVLGDPASWAYFGRMQEYIPHGSFWSTAYGNLTNGRIGAVLWSWENGRFTHLLAMFILGFVAGRKGVFKKDNRTFWGKIFLISIACFLTLYTLSPKVLPYFEYAAILRPAEVIVNSYSNVALTLGWVAGFYFLYDYIGGSFLRRFSPIGRMSLTNYLLQSMVGSFIYYGWGLGMYAYSGTIISIMIGLILSVLMYKFSTTWMKHHKRGPLETLWHRFTWMGTKV